MKFYDKSKVQIEPVFISFYTNEGLYPKFAKKLQDSLTKFNLKSDIQVKKPFMSWEEGTSYKCNFILDRLLSYRTSVVWLDIDTEIWKKPTLLFGNHDFAIYNWFADTNHHLSNQIEHNPTAKKLFSAGGVIKFGYTAGAIELLIRWISLIQSYDNKKADDPILDLTFNRFSPPVNFLWLPKEYNRMDKHTHHWSNLDPHKVVINHDYTGGAHRKNDTK